MATLGTQPMPLADVTAFALRSASLLLLAVCVMAVYGSINFLTAGQVTLSLGIPSIAGFYVVRSISRQRQLTRLPRA